MKKFAAMVLLTLVVFNACGESQEQLKQAGTFGNVGATPTKEKLGLKMAPSKEKLRLKPEAGNLLVASASTASAPSASPALSDRKRILGLTQAYHLGQELGKEAAPSWERLVFRWDHIQDSPGASVVSKAVPFALIDTERAKDIEPVGLILGTPPFARQSPQDGPRSVPKNLKLAWSDPENYFGQYCHETAKAYKGRIETWIIWNEPDIAAEDKSDYFTLAGSVEDYYLMLKTCYLAIKAANHEATVVMAGLSHWSDVVGKRPLYFDRLLSVISKDKDASKNNYYFDVANLHLYSDPRSLYRISISYKQIMAKYRLNKPIWISESNVAVEDKPSGKLSAFSCTEQDQAHYIVQATVLSLAGGASRLSVYKAMDSPSAEGQANPLESSGLIREDRSKRLAFSAFQVIGKHLQDVTKAAYFSDGSYEGVRLSHEDGRVSIVIWNNGTQSLQLQLNAKLPQTAIDALGKKSELPRLRSGAFLFELAPATCRSDPQTPRRALVGGTPLILIDHN